MFGGLLVLMSLFALPQTAIAQGAIRMNRVQVEIWPEYDQAEALVILRGSLSPDIGQLPVELTIRIPAAAEAPHAVALRQDGQMFNAPYTRSVVDEWALIQFETDQVEFQIEYYDPGLSFSGAQRRFDFNWPGDYPVDNLVLLLQHPVGASGVQTVPSMGTPNPGANGLLYQGLELGAIAAGQRVELTVAYSKSDSVLSVDALPAANSIAPVQTSSTTIDSGAGNRLLAQVFAGVLIVAGIGLVGYWAWSTERLGKPQPVFSAPATSKENLFCHDCGQSAQAGDHFCRACGTKLRR
jgi:hypothetical protein